MRYNVSFNTTNQYIKDIIYVQILINSRHQIYRILNSYRIKYFMFAMVNECKMFIHTMLLKCTGSGTKSRAAWGTGLVLISLGLIVLSFISFKQVQISVQNRTWNGWLEQSYNSQRDFVISGEITLVGNFLVSSIHWGSICLLTILLI